MTKEELLKKFGLYFKIQNNKDVSMEEYDELLKETGLDCGDQETIHWEIDADLLKYINDKEITEAFGKIDKWYA